MTDPQFPRQETPPPAPLNYLPAAPPAGHAVCPKCGGEAKPVSFTWWGGLLGPRMLSHVKCGTCKYAFNGKTGRSNDTAIATYAGVAIVIVTAALAAALFL